jgi:RHS repeat-associated protein
VDHNHSVNRINVSLKPLHRHRGRNVSRGACVHKKNKHLALTGTQTNATLGDSYLYADGSLPSWALLGEYGNGGVSSTGRTEYIWLPTQDGSAIPVGLYRSGKLHATHTDHLGTPRLITNETNTPQWQWPYSAFGDNAPTGILKPTTNAASAFTSVPATQGSGTTTTATATLLATSAPTQINNLRFPGQYSDSETGLFYNYFRTYDPRIRGGYIQPDPIGLGGGWNRFDYGYSSPLRFTDPTGELVFIPPAIVWGVPIVAGAWWAATRPPIAGPTYAKPPENARDPNGPKAPGKPGEAEGFKDPKGGESWVRNPNGRGSGWQGADGGVWCPTGPDSGSTGDAHGGPHWDVQYPGGRYDNVYPGGRRR